MPIICWLLKNYETQIKTQKKIKLKLKLNYKIKWIISESKKINVVERNVLGKI